MAEKSIPTTRGEGKIVFIRSFSDPSVTYRVDTEALTCTCRRFRFTGTCEKHILLATAIQKVGVRFGREAAEEHLERLVRRIYRPVSVQESYRVFTEAVTSPFATRAIRNTAQRRHARFVASQGKVA